MTRDICIKTNNENICREFNKKISSLLKKENVIHWNDPSFSKKLAKYIEDRKAKNFNKKLTKAPNFLDWYEEETNDYIKLFIWNSEHTPEEEETKDEIINNNEYLQRELLDYSTIEEENFDYTEGDIVLTVKCNGAYARFHRFDSIYKHGNFYYIFSFSDTKYNKPFKVDETVRAAIKEKIGSWLDEEGECLTDLKGQQLRDFADLVRKIQQQ